MNTPDPYAPSTPDAVIETMLHTVIESDIHAARHCGKNKPLFAANIHTGAAAYAAARTMQFLTEVRPHAAQHLARELAQGWDDGAIAEWAYDAAKEAGHDPQAWIDEIKSHVRTVGSAIPGPTTAAPVRLTPEHLAFENERLRAENFARNDHAKALEGQLAALKRTREPIQLFGPERVRIGYATDEWAVWIIGPDSVMPADTLAEALAYAAEVNAVAVANYDGHPFSPVIHAVVLHLGYAWKRDTTTEPQEDGDA